MNENLSEEAAEWRNRVSSATSLLVRAASSVTAILVALLFVVGYLSWGLLGGFTTAWFSWLHAVTGVVSLVMVFLIQHAEGRASRAMLLKLDELIAATQGASDELVRVEQEELETQEELEDRAPPGQPQDRRPDRFAEPPAGT